MEDWKVSMILQKDLEGRNEAERQLGVGVGR